MNHTNHSVLSCRVARIAVFALSVLAMSCHADPAQQSAVVQQLPGNSIYQLPISLTDQDGHEFRLSGKRGKPVIVSMFYNSCQFVCPMLIDTLQLTEAGLTPAQRAGLSVLLVTFDPARDSVTVLKTITNERHLDTQHWTLARTDDAAVRKLAAILGIQFKLLENGDYNHSTALVLLDGEGRKLGSTNQIGEVDPQFLKLVQEAAK